MPQTFKRYRCSTCGNLTRFDVTTTRRTKSFYHFTLGGDLTIENEEVLSEKIERVECHWCGSTTAVDEVQPTDPTGSLGDGNQTSKLL